MKKTTKHHFTHLDPEKEASTEAKEGTENIRKDRAQKREDKIATKDLNRVGVTIAIFVLILAAFYLVNTKYNFLTQFSNLFRF